PTAPRTSPPRCARSRPRPSARPCGKARTDLPALIQYLKARTCAGLLLVGSRHPRARPPVIPAHAGIHPAPRGFPRTRERRRAGTTAGRPAILLPPFATGPRHARTELRPRPALPRVPGQRRLPPGAGRGVARATGARGGRRRREGPRPPRGPRQAARPRPHHHPARPGLAVPGDR